MDDPAPPQPPRTLPRSEVLDRLREEYWEQLSVADAQGELSGVAKIRLEVLDAPSGDGIQDSTGLAVRKRRAETLVISLG